MSTMNDARVTIATGDGLDVRVFSVHQAMSQLFRVELRAVSANPDIDLDAVIANEASFVLDTQLSRQTWTGLCLEMEQLRVDPDNLATYRLVIVPRAWLLTQRKNYRIFQYESELDIVKKLLGEWGVEHEVRCNGANHIVRKFRVQYGESDFAFVSRMLEDAGITYYFEEVGGTTTLVLDDEPETRALTHPMIQFHERPNPGGTFVTHVAVRSRLRPGTLTLGDLDYRRQSTKQPRVTASVGLPQERILEQFDYEPGAMLYESQGDGTPAADDRGVARTDENAGRRKAQNRLYGQRNDARVVSLESNLLDLAPGRIFNVIDHPHRLLAVGSSLLVTGSILEGEYNGDWRAQVEAVPAAVPYRPEPVTPKPVVYGLESATVVGPGAEEIHTDEYGRVRVHFHWDRESRRDETSSCWLPTNQPWAGSTFGGINLPRIGQEVLVEFLGGDPDRPVVVGRVYTETNPVPDPLPKYKRVTGLFSESSPRMVMGASGGAPAGASPSIFGGTPMSAQDIAGQVTNTGIHQAPSPTGVNHQWKGSGFKIDDMSGAENLYLQANKDMHWVVHNNWKTVVGNHRAAFIGTDDIIRVVGNQKITIGSDQDPIVQRNQTNVVTKDRQDTVKQKFKQEAVKTIKVQSTEESVGIKADGAIDFTSDQGIEIRVKNSIIKIQPSLIRVDGGDNKVHLNPRYSPGAYLSAGPSRRG